MRLLYFVIQINVLGGYSRIVIDKVNWLAQHGYEVFLCDIESWPTPPCYPIDERVTFIQGNMDTTPGGIVTRLRGTVSAINRIRKIIDAVKPDVIINAHCPIVAYSLPFIRTSIPKVIECHKSMQGIDAFDKFVSSKLFSWVHHWSIRWIYGKYDSLVVLTKEDQKAWRLGNCSVIYNFSNLKPLENNVIQDKNGGHQIIMMARLSHEKRIDLMIDIWSRIHKDFPGWRVKVLGEGEERPLLERLIAEKDIEDSFLLPGSVQDVRTDMLQSDIFCMTSEYEGFGLVAIEAMQMGLPVIAFDYIGVRDVIDVDNTGYVVPFPDTEKYADKLRTLISNECDRTRLVENAKVWVHRFDKETIMQQWTELFMSLINKRNG